MMGELGDTRSSRSNENSWRLWSLFEQAQRLHCARGCQEEGVWRWDMQECYLCSQTPPNAPILTHTWGRLHTHTEDPDANMLYTPTGLMCSHPAGQWECSSSASPNLWQDKPQSSQPWCAATYLVHKDVNTLRGEICSNVHESSGWCFVVREKK